MNFGLSMLAVGSAFTGASLIGFAFDPEERILRYTCLSMGFACLGAAIFIVSK